MLRGSTSCSKSKLSLFTLLQHTNINSKVCVYAHVAVYVCKHMLLCMCVFVCVPPVDQGVYQVSVSLSSSQVEQCHTAVTN